MNNKAKHIKYLKLLLRILINNIGFILCFVGLLLVFILLNPFKQTIDKFLTFIFSDNVDKNTSVYSLIRNLIRVLFSAIFTELIHFIFTKIPNREVKKFILKSNRRRSIYNFLYRFYKRHNNINAIPTLLINIFVKGKPINYHNQQKHIKDLSNQICQGSSEKHIAWIMGEAHSGKTTTVFRFLENISENEKTYEEFENKVYYFDLGKEFNNFSIVQNKLESSKYKDCLLILDNIHKLKNKDLINFIVMMESSNDIAKYIICLSQKLESFCYSQETYERLNNFINNNANRIVISVFKKNEDINYEENVDNNTIEQIKAHTKNSDFDNFCLQTVGENIYSDPILAIHCYNLFWLSNTKTKKKYIYKIFRTINCSEQNEIHIYLLSFIIHASLFSGDFDVTWLNEYLSQTFNFLKFINAKINFRILQSTGFISIARGSYSNWFVFHERLARVYFKDIISSSSYKNANKSVVEYLISKNKNNKNYANAWKYSLILYSKYKDVDMLFDKSLENVNFMTLLDDFKFICNSKKIDKSFFYRELGILYDRTGRLDKASECFSKKLKLEFDPVVYINYIQVDHSQYDENIIKNLIVHSDVYCKLSARYWKLHIDIHDGVFDFTEFKSMLNLFKNNYTKILSEHPYDGIHLLRRWYFDCFRCYYLSGIMKPTQLKDIINSIINKKIKSLIETESYNTKFRKAFYLHYDILFLVGVFNEVKFDEFEKWDKIMLGANSILPLRKIADQGETSLTEFIAKKAENYYQNSINAMKNIMDKSYIYSELRIWELQLAHDNITINEIRSKEPLIKEYIEYAKKIKIDEYVAYGYTYLLKIYLVGMFCYDTEYDDNLETDQILNNLYVTDEKIQYCFSQIEKYHKKYRNSRENIYCMLRLELYRTLYEIITNKNNNPSEAILKLLEKAKHNKYQREIKLLKYLSNVSFNRQTILNVFKYYPLVIQ